MMRTTAKTLVRQHSVTVEVERDRGAQIRDGWEHHAYVLTVKTRRHAVKGVPWTQGYAIESSPSDNAEGVLAALILDAYCYESSSDFADFCEQLGLDTDSRKAHDAYVQCGDHAKAVKALLGVNTLPTITD